MSSKKRLGELLLDAGVIDQAMLQAALGHQRRWGGRLGQAITDLKLASEEAIVEVLARHSGYEVARLDRLEPYALEQAKKLVGREFAQRNNVFPMAADTTTITLAMSDPTNLALTDELRFRTGRRVKVCIAGDRQIAETIRAHYPAERTGPDPIALDLEPSGEAVQLAEPFEGGSADDMRAMLEPNFEATMPRRPPPPVTSRPPTTAAPLVAPPAPPVAAAPPLAPPARAVGHATPPPVLPRSAPVPTRPGMAAVAPAGAEAPVGRPPQGTAPVVLASAPVPEEEQVEGRLPGRELGPQDAAILDALDQLAKGVLWPDSPVDPVQVTGALLKLLLDKRLVTERELLDVLTGRRG